MPASQTISSTARKEASAICTYPLAHNSGWIPQRRLAARRIMSVWCLNVEPEYFGIYLELVLAVDVSHAGFVMDHGFRGTSADSNVKSSLSGVLYYVQVETRSLHSVSETALESDLRNAFLVRRSSIQWSDGPIVQRSHERSSDQR